MISPIIWLATRGIRVSGWSIPSACPTGWSTTGTKPWLNSRSPCGLQDAAEHPEEGELVLRVVPDAEERAQQVRRRIPRPGRQHGREELARVHGQLRGRP